ncbi:UNVERIFIED_CONTAM: hypothetical protein Sangu_1029100 [Sesamum angustifolium]|uniref:Uncharacterized protein n=1 Tax=Sesamum angustifolium TaxID=2727405 RepID=A0AAW2NXQ1_9LAMI
MRRSPPKLSEVLLQAGQEEEVLKVLNDQVIEEAFPFRKQPQASGDESMKCHGRPGPSTS